MINVTFAFFALLAIPAFAQGPVSLTSEKIELTNNFEACKAVRKVEPKYDFTYQVRRQGALRTITRPAYSDICTYPTQQFTSRIYAPLDSTGKSPIVGLMGSNEDRDDFGIAVFSHFVVVEL